MTQVILYVGESHTNEAGGQIVLSKGNGLVSFEQRII